MSIAIINKLLWCMHVRVWDKGWQRMGRYRGKRIHSSKFLQSVHHQLDMLHNETPNCSSQSCWVIIRLHRLWKQNLKKYCLMTVQFHWLRDAKLTICVSWHQKLLNTYVRHWNTALLQVPTCPGQTYWTEPSVSPRILPQTLKNKAPLMPYIISVKI